MTPNAGIAIFSERSHERKFIGGPPLVTPKETSVRGASVAATQSEFRAGFGLARFSLIGNKV